MIALYIISGLSLVSLLAEIANLKRGLTVVIVAGLLAALVSLFIGWTLPSPDFSSMVQFDAVTVAMTALVIGVGICWFWMARDYFARTSHQTDRSALVLFVIIGAMLMVSFANLAILFLGIEILSISLYALAGSDKERLSSNESSFKYFLMGSFATGFLLMGMALVYGATGSFVITEIAARLAQPAELPAFFYAGMLLMMVGMAFKISAVPFHFWAPDVYDGAPVPITALMSTLVKTAAVVAFVKIMRGCFSSVEASWLSTLQVMAVLTLVIANVTAAYQTQVKRMLAYSSVGHIGYLFLIIIANTNLYPTVWYYLAGYSVASLAAFTVLQLVESNEGFQGLWKRNGFLAAVMSIALLSLAGIPPLAGFFAKYMALSQAMSAGYTSLVVLAVFTSVVGVYYYGRVILAMFTAEPAAGPITVSPANRLLLAVLVALLMVAGVAPDWCMSLLR
jgi:NADH-quinone oxidoreductase subunit N